MQLLDYYQTTINFPSLYEEFRHFLQNITTRVNYVNVNTFCFLFLNPLRTIVNSMRYTVNKSRWIATKSCKHVMILCANSQHRTKLIRKVQLQHAKIARMKTWKWWNRVKVQSNKNLKIGLGCCNWHLSLKQVYLSGINVFWNKHTFYFTQERALKLLFTKPRWCNTGH